MMSTALLAAAGGGCPWPLSVPGRSSSVATAPTMANKSLTEPRMLFTSLFNSCEAEVVFSAVAAFCWGTLSTWVMSSVCLGLLAGVLTLGIKLKIRIEFFGAVRADAVTELHVGMLLDVLFYFLPIPLIVANVLA